MRSESRQLPAFSRMRSPCRRLISRLSLCQRDQKPPWMATARPGSVRSRACGLARVSTAPAASPGSTAMLFLPSIHAMGKPQREFFPVEQVDWTPAQGGLVAGLYERIPATDAASGVATRMLRFDPGVDTSAAGPQIH